MFLIELIKSLSKTPQQRKCSEASIMSEAQRRWRGAYQFTVYSLQFTVVISPPRTIGRRFTSPRTGGRQISSVRLAPTLNFRISLCGGPSLGPKSRRGNLSRRAETSLGSNHAQTARHATTLAVKTIHANPVSPDSGEPGRCESRDQELTCSGLGHLHLRCRIKKTLIFAKPLANYFLSILSHP